MKDIKTSLTYIDNKKVNKAVSTQRIDAFPIEYYSIFDCLSALSVYIDGPLSYEGQPVAVKNNGKIELYVLDSSVTNLNPISGVVKLSYGGDISSLYVTTISTENKVIYGIGEKDGIVTAYTRYITSADFGENKLCVSQVDTLVNILDNLSTNIDHKVHFKTPEKTWYDNLSVEKIPAENYYELYKNNELCNNTFYIISSDFINAYDEQLCNLTMPGGEYEGVAVTDKYLDHVITENGLNTVNAMRNQMWNTLSSCFGLSSITDVPKEKEKYELSTYCDCIYNMLFILSSWYVNK